MRASNNKCIHLFGKTAKLLVSSMTWVEETKDSIILVTSLQKIKCSIRRVGLGMSFVINTGIWSVSLDCLNALIIDKICDRRSGSRGPRLGTFACRHQAGRRNVKDDVPHRHESPREIYTYRLTS